MHRWVPWIAGYSRDFVEDALSRHAPSPAVVLDPFAGAGTTLVEADLAGHAVIGYEINPYAVFISRAKVNAHRRDPDTLRRSIRRFRTFMQSASSKKTAPVRQRPAGFRTKTPFYSPAVERQVLFALDFVDGLADPEVADLFRLAFAATMVEYSNYSYEPSLGRRAAAGRPEVTDYPVAETLVRKLSEMTEDIAWYRSHRSTRRRRKPSVLQRSFLDGYRTTPAGSVDLLVTSPPYLNNYHYNRNTRPQLYWLDLCRSPADLKPLERLNFGTYWQTARERETIPLDPAIADSEISDTVAEVRRRNGGRGIYGGRGWANYAAAYFNDCARFARGARWCLRPGGTALVVIGNSILQGIEVPTDRFLARTAERDGLEVVDIHHPRSARTGNSIVNSSVRAGSAGARKRLYEAVVELKKA